MTSSLRKGLYIEVAESLIGPYSIETLVPASYGVAGGYQVERMEAHDEGADELTGSSWVPPYYYMCSRVDLNLWGRPFW